jgi:hypothetical protein
MKKKCDLCVVSDVRVVEKQKIILIREFKKAHFLKFKKVKKIMIFLLKNNVQCGKQSFF